MRKTKEEIEEFYATKKRIEDYHAMQNQNVPISIAKVPTQKQKQKVDDWI